MSKSEGDRMKCNKCGRQLELTRNLDNGFGFTYPWWIRLTGGNDYWYCESCGVLIHEERGLHRKAIDNECNGGNGK